MGIFIISDWNSLNRKSAARRIDWICTQMKSYWNGGRNYYLFDLWLIWKDCLTTILKVPRLDFVFQIWWEKKKKWSKNANENLTGFRTYDFSNLWSFTQKSMENINYTKHQTATSKNKLLISKIEISKSK